jgi:hypothetical protein
MKHIFPTLILIILLNSGQSIAQTVYQHVSDENIYSFIDEMATMHLIDANTAIKPYSRLQIAEWLQETAAQTNLLSKPQQARLSKFLQEYALEAGKLKTGKATIYKKDSTLSLHLLPPEATWRDPLFRAIIRPVYGIRYFSNAKGNFYQSYGGLEGIGYIGTKWAGYASLRDNHNSVEPIARPTYFTQEAGGNYKNGADYSEMRGGITYTWKWGTFGLLKDHLQWGDNQNGSNILSGRTPSFAMIKLHLNPVKWLEFDYFHGWLVSEEIDSVSSYYTSNGDYRTVFREKYIAANMYTFKPFRRFNLSIGNSIIYSDVPVQPAYLIPFFFYKSVDHTLNHGVENQNSSLFMNISSRQIKYLHIYASVFVDEFSIERVTDPNTTNFVSYKGGFSLSGWPFRDLSFTTELTRTTPITYKHRVPATTFESNKFNLGHYMKDNSQDFYASISYSLWKTLKIKASYLYAMHGNEYQYVFGSVGVDEHPVLQDKTWTNNTITFRAEMLPFTNIRIFAEYAHGTITGYDVDGNSALYYENLYSPEYLRGETNTVTLGFGMGF